MHFNNSPQPFRKSIEKKLKGGLVLRWWNFKDQKERVQVARYAAPATTAPWSKIVRSHGCLSYSMSAPLV